MIRFCCEGCGKQYSVPNKYAGKKVRCKICNSMNRIPIQEMNSEDNDFSGFQLLAENIPPGQVRQANSQVASRKQVSKSKSPFVYVVVGMFFLLIIAGISFAIFSKIHKKKEFVKTIQQLKEEGDACFSSKDYDRGEDIYQRITSLVSKEDFRSEHVIDSIIDDVNSELEKIDQYKFRDKHLKRISTYIEKADTCFSDGKLVDAYGYYKETEIFLNDNKENISPSMKSMLKHVHQQLQMLSECNQAQLFLERGDSFFRDKLFGDAIKSYENAVIRLNGINNKLAFVPKWKAETDNRIQQAIKQKDMHHPTFLTPSNVKKSISAMRKDKCFQFTIWAEGFGHMYVDYRSPTGNINSISLSYFEVKRAFVNGKALGGLYYSHRLDSLYYIRNLPDENNKFEIELTLHFVYGSLSSKARKEDAITMLLNLPFTKDEMFNFVDNLGQTPFKPPLVKCKITDSTIITKETKKILQKKGQMGRIGGVQFTANVYFCEIVEWDHPACKINRVEFAAIKDRTDISNKNIEEEYEAYVKKVNEIARRRNAEVAAERERVVKEISGSIVQNLINSGIISTARFERFSKPWSGLPLESDKLYYEKEISVQYRITNNSLIPGIINVAMVREGAWAQESSGLQQVEKWKCREVYLNGKEMWSQGVLGNYRQ